MVGLGAAATAAPLALALIALAPGPRVDACATVVGPGDEAFVAQEEAIIVWDAATKTEHFVRRAAFTTDADDLGFLVPTPTEPQLAEASPEGFARLAAVVSASTRRSFRIDPTPFTCLLGVTRRKSSRSSPVSVRVLQRKRVAGYDAVVLEARGAGALAAWLDEHGYAASPALEAWLAPYVADGWKITAFRHVRGEGETEGVRSGTVRLSFRTERPFFPYREPRATRANEHTLRLFCIAAGRVDAALAAGADPHERYASTRYAAPTADLAARLEGVVPAGAIPEGAWLTEIDDLAFGRPDDSELYIEPSSAGELLPSVTHTIPVPAELLLLVVAIGCVYGWRVWRRKGAALTLPPSAAPPR